MNTQNESLFHGGIVTARRSIYTASSFARKSLLYLQEAGSLRAGKPHTSSRAGLDSYLFFMVVSGSGTLSFKGNIYASKSFRIIPLHIGDCVFLDCRYPYSHTTSNDLWQLKWAHFNGIGMRGIYEKFLERCGGPVFHPTADSLIPWQLDRIYNISIGNSYVRDMEINEAIASLLTSVMERAWNEESGKHPHTQNSAQKDKPAGDNAIAGTEISEVRNYLDKHYMENTSLDALAEIMHFNKFYLSRQFRARYGMTIGNYRTGVRINEAKKLLRFTDLSLAEAGARVGITDANYFSRIFKKVEGITPGEYRKSWKAPG